MATLQVIHIGDRGVRASREINLSRPATLAERIKAKGLDEKHQVRLMRRRDRYAQRQDRAKLFAGTKQVDLYVKHFWSGIAGRPYTPDNASRDLATLRNPPSTADYVSAWTRLNHLKEA